VENVRCGLAHSPHRILLTQTPRTFEIIYGAGALALLSELVLHDGAEPLQTPALIAAA
jgi:hypothetical protein